MDVVLGMPFPCSMIAPDGDDLSFYATIRGDAGFFRVHAMKPRG
jgi:hypothetical protein